MGSTARSTRSLFLLYAAVLAAALACGLTGIEWGLPSRARAERVLPAGVFGPELHASLQSSWRKMHGRLGANLMLNPDSFSRLKGAVDVAPGWKTPPVPILDSIRSFHLRTVHDDEQTLFLILSRMRPQRLQLNPHFFAYGGGYVYPLGGWMAIGHVIRQMSLHTSLAPYLAEPGKMGRMYRWGRLGSVLSYLACVVVLLEIGRRWLGVWAGAAGALFLLLAPGMIIQAHTMKPHSQWTFLTLWALLISFDILRRGSLRDYLWGGAVSGLAVGTLVSAYPACLIVGAAALLRAWGKPATRHIDFRRVLGAAAISIAVFFIVNPYWLLDFGKVAAEFSVLKGWMTVSPLNPLRVAWGPLRHSITNPAFALWVAGLGWALWRGRRSPQFLLCAIAVLLVLAPSIIIAQVVDVRQVRYFLPIIGIGGLLAGGLLEELFASKKLRPLVLACCLVVFGNLSVHAALYAWNFKITAGGASNHHRAGDWVEAKIPAGASIGLFRLPAPANTAYFRYHKYRIRLMEHAAFRAGKVTLPDYLILARPDYDERPILAPTLGAHYTSVKTFVRPQLGWATIHPSATTANPEIEIFKLTGTR